MPPKNPLKTPDDAAFMERLRIRNDTDDGRIGEYKNSAVTRMKKGGKKKLTLYQVKTRG